MDSLVFLVEEPSMKAFLVEILPRLVPAEISFFVVPHQGKSDLESSIPRKLRGWDSPGARFLILRDQHGADCIELKRSLMQICNSSRANREFVIRIVCQELESWLLGDWEAVMEAYQASIPPRVRKCDPDSLVNAQEILRKVTSDRYRKVSGAARIGRHISFERNRSRSFQVFIRIIKRWVVEIQNRKQEI